MSTGREKRYLYSLVRNTTRVGYTPGRRNKPIISVLIIYYYYYNKSTVSILCMSMMVRKKDGRAENLFLILSPPPPDDSKTGVVAPDRRLFIYIYIWKKKKKTKDVRNFGYLCPSYIYIHTAVSPFERLG